jgi:hypothetical protein
MGNESIGTRIKIAELALQPTNGGSKRHNAESSKPTAGVRRQLASLPAHKIEAAKMRLGRMLERGSALGLAAMAAACKYRSLTNTC